MMEQFLLGLASLTTTLQPFVIFITLIALIFFMVYLKKQVDLFMRYQKSVMISLQQIANKKNKFRDPDIY